MSRLPSTISSTFLPSGPVDSPSTASPVEVTLQPLSAVFNPPSLRPARVVTAHLHRPGADSCRPKNRHTKTR